MLEAVALPGINRLLRTNTWALDRLRAHAGKTALVACPPFELHVRVGDSGELTAAGSGATPDVVIAVTPGIMLRAATRDSAAWSAAQVTGDVEFAAAIDYLRRNLRWDYEEDLSKFIGDIAAHRLASGARQLEVWARNAALNFGQALAEYATYEKPIVASARAIEEYNGDVDALRDAAERLEKRLELLRRRLSHPQ